MLGAMGTREGRLRAIMCSCEYRWYNGSLGVERTVIIAEDILVKKVSHSHTHRECTQFLNCYQKKKKIK